MRTRTLLLLAACAPACARLVDRDEAFVGYRERLGSAAGCADDNALCIDWAAKGECQSNAGAKPYSTTTNVLLKLRL